MKVQNMKPPQTHTVSATMLKWGIILRSQSTHPNEMTTAIWGKLKTACKPILVLDGRATTPDFMPVGYRPFTLVRRSRKRHNRSTNTFATHARPVQPQVFAFLQAHLQQTLRFLGQQYFRGNLVSTVDSDEMEGIFTATAQRIHFWADLKYQIVAAGIPQQLITPLISHSFRRGFVASDLAINTPQRIISAILKIKQGSVNSYVRAIIPTHHDSFFNGDLTVVGSATT
ncbi:hypothetical protein SARC_07307 [Sphaeroforma arctica JP610]|uniref:Uncharacterized protein n=1 Tax=Sphaeroforma arctica JP610 TaxID=667725 RepID=A0A0L0FU29_9EUKA|nr:hypothetical protein SARC_07307 [Sphaeroforma arctica JP610]KNC80332.1 hypothetical protein SARC_07307 [Sphaeroforma arctica JP610]|eukprot:XP_014154234.1 hypothetical protein SARC_07307 [Sphaeroforma arctica JP610]